MRAAMQSSETRTVVPATAVRVIDILGGTPIEQAIPEDYTLAAVVLDALESKNNGELQFVLKCYLPVRMAVLGRSGRVALKERMGLVSATVEIPEIRELDSVAERASSVTDIDAGLSLIDDAAMLLDEIARFEVITVPGLLSSGAAAAVSRLTRWPSRDAEEPYAIVLPEVIESNTTEKALSRIAFWAEHLHIDRSAEVMVNELEERLRELLSTSGGSTDSRIARLNERIARLQREVEYLESRLHSLDTLEKRSAIRDEIEAQLEARRRALLRDKERRRQMIASSTTLSKQIEEHTARLHDALRRAQQRAQELRQTIESVSVPSVTSDTDVGLTILVPFVITGYSRKGVLGVRVFPPLRFEDPEGRVGRRRDFVNPFRPADAALSDLASRLETRIDKDVALMKLLHDSARGSNILTLSVTRRLLTEGLNLLRADGLVKRSAIDRVHDVLSRFPEQEIVLTGKAIVSPAAGMCNVRFQVTDMEGRPVSGATINLGAVVAASGKDGTADLALPRSTYSGFVTASGYRDQPIEFTLRSGGDFVVPVVLVSLPPEERLAKALEELESRAERIAEIRERLSTAFLKHGDMLLDSPTHRATLYELLRELGHDPEEWVSEARRKREMITRLLSGELEEKDLKRAILRIGDSARDLGGIMLLSDVLVRLDREGWVVKPKDVERVLKSMAREGLIEGVSRLDDGAKIVRFVPVALTDDPKRVLTLAAQNNGVLAVEDVVLALGWSEQRAMNVLGLLVERGLAREDTRYSSGTRYWFPGLRKKR